MDYHIVNKVELIDNELVYTILGYTESKEDALALDGWKDWQEWMYNNRIALYAGDVTLSDRFDECSTCHEVSWTTDYVDESQMSLIKTLD
jgi:hypothetical protein